MLDKMLGVSPPLKGEAPDSKLASGRDLRGTSKSEYKKEFEKALEKKLDKKDKLDKTADDPADRKEVVRKSEEFRADKKDKKSLGGIKKKVTEDEDKMVSNVMASNESKVEIPDSKIENPAEIEVVIPEKLKVSVETEVKAASGAQSGLIQNLTEMAKAVATGETTKMTQLNLPKAAEPTPLVNPLPEALISSMQSQLQEPVQGENKIQNLEAELSAAVGFNPDEGMRQTSGELLQKMRTFDVDKNITSEKSQTFEQNILSRLQNEQIKSVGQPSEKQFSEQNFSGENRGNSGQESPGSMKDLRSDLLDANQAPLAAGQTQTEFKTQLGSVSAAQDSALAGKLAENREANISEIMNQAQYLVTKGGGEVSVKMSPEGLGELHLKVIFQDGKLNIEMQTQNKDIKKLVEESLSELKSGLAAHRLSLEHVKIDTVNATNADNNTQFQSNLNHSGSQESAREQWRDFQSNMNNQSDKKSSHGASSVQPNVSPRGASAKTASAVNAMRTYGGTKGATVNRVA